eukprot:590360-Amphidinium_carterae.1
MRRFLSSTHTRAIFENANQKVTLLPEAQQLCLALRFSKGLARGGLYRSGAATTSTQIMAAQPLKRIASGPSSDV